MQSNLIDATERFSARRARVALCRFVEFSCPEIAEVARERRDAIVDVVFLAIQTPPMRKPIESVLHSVRRCLTFRRLRARPPTIRYALVKQELDAVQTRIPWFPLADPFVQGTLEQNPHLVHQVRMTLYAYLLGWEVL